MNWCFFHRLLGLHQQAIVAWLATSARNGRGSVVNVHPTHSRSSSRRWEHSQDQFRVCGNARSQPSAAVSLEGNPRMLGRRFWEHRTGKTRGQRAGRYSCNLARMLAKQFGCQMELKNLGIPLMKSRKGGQNGAVERRVEPGCTGQNVLAAANLTIEDLLRHNWNERRD